MEQFDDLQAMLDQMDQPAFLVKEDAIAFCNKAALQHMAAPGMMVGDLLITGQEEFAKLTEGSLYLSICLAGSPYGCCVTPLETLYLFTLQTKNTDSVLQALSLAAMQLRVPLSEISLELDKFCKQTNFSDPNLNRQLSRLYRIIGNMSDAATAGSSGQSVQDLRAILWETLEKARAYMERSGINLTCKLPSLSIYCVANAQLLERAVYNLLSNACKFSGANKEIHVTVTQVKSKLYITVSNHPDPLFRRQQGTMFNRYSREPGLEDQRFGIGLGMSLIQSAAAAHGGAVLVEQNAEEVRITMSLSIEKSAGDTVHTPVLIPDVYGGMDQALIELSDVLSSELYM